MIRQTLASAIVVTYNSRRHISACLTSLARSTIRPDEIIVVDNNSTDGTADFVRSTFPDVTLLDYWDNRGFAEGNNRALRIASGRFCFLLNPDAAVAPDCLQQLLEAMEKDPRIGVAVPKVLLAREPSVINSAGLNVNRIGYGWDRGFLEWDCGQYDTEAPVVAGSGCAMLLRRSMLKEIGTFDSTYFLYYEDVDLCLRAWLAGFRVQYVPKAVAWHDMKVSGRSLYYNECLDHRHRLRTMLKNLPAATLLSAGPRMVAFELKSVVAAVRDRRWKSLRLRLKAWAWNGRHLVSSIRLRARIQRSRTVDGRVLSDLFTEGWGAPSARAALPDYAEAYEDSLDPSRAAPEVRLGVDDRGRLGLGWYGSEAIDGLQCRWCCGYGIVFLKRPGPRSEATLRVVCRSPRETIATAIVNGIPQGQWLISPGGWREYALDVKADSEVVRLALIPGAPFVPAKAFPPSRDRRVLGFAVSRVALESSCAVAAPDRPPDPPGPTRANMGTALSCVVLGPTSGLGNSPPSKEGGNMSSLFATPKPVSSIEDCHFYHTMDVPGYGTVDGEWDLRGRAREYLGGISLKGKRVLEIGTASGFIGFYMESQGAEVVAFDLSQDHDWDVVPYAQYDHQRDVLAFKTHIKRINNAFWFNHKALNSKARMVYGTAYAIPEAIGLVDISTFGCVLLHLRDPFLALQNALRLTTETVIVTDVYPPGMADGAHMHFVPGFREIQPRETWWNLPPALIESFLGVLGFEEAVVTYHDQQYRGRQQRLYTVVGRRTRVPTA